MDIIVKDGVTAVTYQMDGVSTVTNIRAGQTIEIYLKTGNTHAIFLMDGLTQIKVKSGKTMMQCLLDGRPRRTIKL